MIKRIHLVEQRYCATQHRYGSARRSIGVGFAWIHALSEVRVKTKYVCLGASRSQASQGPSRCWDAAGAALADSQQHDLDGTGVPVGVAPTEPRRSMRTPVPSSLINPEEYQPNAGKTTRSCASSSCCCCCCACSCACGLVPEHDVTDRCAAWVQQPKSTGGGQRSDEHVPCVDPRDQGAYGAKPSIHQMGGMLWDSVCDGVVDVLLRGQNLLARHETCTAFPVIRHLWTIFWWL